MQRRVGLGRRNVLVPRHVEINKGDRVTEIFMPGWYGTVKEAGAEVSGVIWDGRHFQYITNKFLRVLTRGEPGYE